MTLGYLDCKIPDRLSIKFQLSPDKICFIKALTNLGIYLRISVKKKKNARAGWGGWNIPETFMTSVLTSSGLTGGMGLGVAEGGWGISVW